MVSKERKMEAFAAYRSGYLVHLVGNMPRKEPPSIIFVQKFIANYSRVREQSQDVVREKWFTMEDSCQQNLYILTI